MAYKIECFNEIAKTWQTIETTRFATKEAANRELDRRERCFRGASANWPRRVVADQA